MERLNWSTLKYIATSPRLLHWRVDHPRPETPALRIGRAIHCLILEAGEFEKRWICAGPCEAVKKKGDVCGSGGSLYLEGSWYCRIKSHAPEGAGDPPEGIEVVTPEELDLVKVCAESLRGHKVASEILSNGDAEQEMEWEDPETGIACRGRVDYLKANAIVDLKSTRQETVRAFTMDVARNLYHGQLAWYHDGAIKAGRLPADAELPYIIAVSTAEPYDVAPFQLSKYTYQAGQILYRDLLLKYKQCQASEWYPGIAPDLLELEVPPWAEGMQGSEEGSGDNW